MKTDYTNIAGKYDRTRARRAINVDPVLAAMAEANGCDEYRALDLGCGTGNYLNAQLQNGPSSVRWDALDASKEMLAVAKGKLADRAVLRCGTADDLPYESETFHFIMLRAVFHHILDKERALGEIVRVLKPGGSLHIVNGAYEYRKDYWVYRYFPETWTIDSGRFWKVDRLFDGLVRRGMHADATVAYRKYYEAKSEVLFLAKNRDLSQLALLSDEAYEAGLLRLTSEVTDGVLTESATLDLRAVRALQT